MARLSGLSCFWHYLYSRPSPRCADGVLGGGLCGLLDIARFKRIEGVGLALHWYVWLGQDLRNKLTAKPEVKLSKHPNRKTGRIL